MEEELKAMVDKLKLQLELSSKRIDELEEDVENMYTFDQLMSVMNGAYRYGLAGLDIDTFQLTYYL